MGFPGDDTVGLDLSLAGSLLSLLSLVATGDGDGDGDAAGTGLDGDS